MPSPRNLPPWVRRLASSAVSTAYTWACELGAVGPDDRLAKGFGAFGEGSVLAFPRGALFNERWIRIGRG
ncbi:MAG TPA: hypothetical protein VE991_07880, partial [Acidimicrobiales bacterium]|nr:hypothetical protein [Acidimicrobiales bacterium]